MLGPKHSVCIMKYDLSTFYGNIAPQGNTFPLNGYVDQIGRCFTLYEHDCNIITNNNLNVTELEVYKVIGRYPIFLIFNCQLL